MACMCVRACDDFCVRASFRARVCVNAITGFSNRERQHNQPTKASNDKMEGKYGKDIQIPLDIVQSI